ncbi:MAG: GumC family protein, partial [Hyphomicrobiaceae bacterium]
MQDFIGHTSPGQDVAASTINLAWVGRILKDRWRLIACSSLVTLLIAIAYLMTATPQYVSTLWLGLDDQKPKVLSSQEMLQSLRFDLGVPMLQQVVEGQITMIRSASIAEKTLKAIDPNFPRNSPIDDRTLAAFGKKLSVERLGSTFIIQVSYSDPDPQRAAKVANTIAAQYIDAQLRERNQAKLSATQWLEKRVEEFKERVRIEGNRIEKFKNEHNLVTVGTELMSERELSRTLDRLIESRADAANALARLKNAEQIVKDPARLDAVFSSSQSPVIGELKRQQLTLSNQLTMTITRMGEDHPDVRVLKAQLN